MQRIKLNNQIFSISDQKKRKKKKNFVQSGRKKEGETSAHVCPRNYSRLPFKVIVLKSND